MTPFLRAIDCPISNALPPGDDSSGTDAEPRTAIFHIRSNSIPTSGNVEGKDFRHEHPRILGWLPFPRHYFFIDQV
jgi:hypothetical protein